MAGKVHVTENPVDICCGQSAHDKLTFPDIVSAQRMLSRGSVCRN